MSFLRELAASFSSFVYNDSQKDGDGGGADRCDDAGQDNGGRMFRTIGCTIGNDIYRNQLQRRNIQDQEDAHFSTGRFASLVVLSQFLHRL